MSFIKAQKITSSLRSPELLEGHHKPTNSVRLTAGIIVADVVGAGILNIPTAVAKFGWALGAGLIVLLLLMNAHVSLLLWRLTMFYPEEATMYDLCCRVFEDAPARQKRFATRTTAGSQYAFFFSMLGIFCLSWGEGFGMLLYNVHLCKPIWVLAGAVLVLPFLGSARALGTWQFLVWLNIAALVGAIAIPLVFFVVHGTAETRAPGSEVYALSPELGAEVAPIFSGVSTFTFAFTSQFMLVEIISEMQDRSQLPRAYIGYATPFMGSAFLLVGLGGYYYLGSSVDAMLPQNLPFGVCFRIAGFCLLLQMMISYLIKGVVTCNGVHKVLFPDTVTRTDTRSWLHWNCIVLSVFTFAFLIANVVPFFGDFVDLVGASVTPLSCFVMPLIMYIKWYCKHGKGKTGPLEWSLIAIEIALAVVLMIGGTILGVQTIIQHWKVYGGPFECHCEDLWNTCECSANHGGIICPSSAYVSWNTSVVV